MPVSINIPQRRQEADPLDKLATALQIAKTGFGIAADMKTLEEAKRVKGEEQKLRDAQLKKMEREEAEASAADLVNTPLVESVRERAKARGITLPPQLSEKQLKGMGVLDDLFKPPPQKDPLVAQMAKDKYEESKQKKEFEKSPEGRLQKLNSGDKARFDNSMLGLQSIQAMDSALAAGDNTFSIIGDNDYTRNLAMAAEAFGRMQSGGAIQKDEEARFLAMSPTAKDSIEQQRKKLEGMQRLFVDRLRTLGFKPDDIGVPLQEIKYGKAKGDALGKTAGGAAAPKPKTVMQNGHVYTLNPETGEYE